MLKQTSDRFLLTFKMGNRTIEVRERHFLDEEVEEFLDTLDAAARRWYRHKPDQENEIQWFALDDGKIVAYGSLSGLGDSVSFGCVIHQDYRGQGLGKVMYSLAPKLAKRYGKTEITGEQDLDNEAAHAICRREGYEFSDPEEDEVSPCGKIVRLKLQVGGIH